MSRWISDFEALEVFYAVIAFVVTAMLTKWARVVERLRLAIRDGRATYRYRKSLRTDCEHLIVVGRRTGFSTRTTFVQLDVVQSDLVPPAEPAHRTADWTSGAVVLVGGPGAGKSTLVKRRLLDFLHRNWVRIPLFLRLRDYVGFESIEAAVIHRLREHGFPNPHDVLLRALQGPGALCVLDGLDEVRQDLREDVIEDINAFHAKYCTRLPVSLVVTCRKEAYRDTPLDIPEILEVCPLSDKQIRKFADLWPLGYPVGKSAATFWRDLSAAPKIHELARSPLLLVGGLMQYTESNEGIPEERFQYLQRVAKWLIADWSTAQGHPPDPLRPLYDRVLPLLAYEMHGLNASEITTADTTRLLQGWLPQLGQDAKDAAKVLDSIRARTGILVIDDKHNVVFAQFGLQEFFASLQLPLQKQPMQVGTLQPLSWWREPILLAVAQQRDPTPWLDALFALDPFLATAAVAECPTPPSVQQSKAVAACLNGIDKNNQSVTAALVPLLRKVKGDLEGQLCRDLERRLSDKRKRARIVGLALATAGTEAATAALARHPDIWADCLASAGYVSESFETLLLDWIESGTDAQSAAASQILAGRLRESVSDKLVALLPALSSSKASKLAASLVEHFFRQNDRYMFSLGGSGLRLLASVIPYLSDPRASLRKEVANQVVAASGKRRHRIGLFEGPIAPGPIAAALLLENSNGKRPTTGQLTTCMESALAWRYDAYVVLAWAITGLTLFAVAAGRSYIPGFAILGSACLVFAAAAKPPTVPWSAGPPRMWEARVTTALTLIPLAAFVSEVTAATSAPDPTGSLLGAAMFAATMAVTMCRPVGMSLPFFDEEEADANGVHRYIKRVSLLVVGAPLVVAVSRETWASQTEVAVLAAALGLAMFILAACNAAFTLQHYRRTRSAAARALTVIQAELAPVRLPASARSPLLNRLAATRSSP